jgi:hypothetical protein
MCFNTIVAKKTFKLVGKFTMGQIFFTLGLKRIALNNELEIKVLSKDYWCM